MRICDGRTAPFSSPSSSQVLLEPLEPRLMLDAATAWPALAATDEVATSQIVVTVTPGEDAPLGQGTTNIPVSELVPLAVGNSWNYIGTDTYGAMTRSVTTPGGINTGGTFAYQLRQTDTGLAGTDVTSYYLSGVAGLKLHRRDWTEDVYSGLYYTEVENYAPLSLLPATVSVGDVITFTGGFSGTSAVDVWTGYVNGQFNVVSRETAVTPAGTFNALKMTMSAQRSRDIVGGTEWQTFTSTFWFEEDVGLVQESTTVITSRTGEMPVYKTTDVQLNSYSVLPVSEAAFVTMLYNGILRRAADTGGLQTWATDIAGGVPRAWAVQSFLTSNEFETYVAPVARLYRAYLNRSPDTGGLDIFVGLRHAGVGLDAIALTFANSAEFIGLHGTVFTTADNTNFVRFLYTDVLGRIPNEAPGTNEVWPWVVQLNAGMPRQTLMTVFTESGEYANATWNDLHAIMMGIGLLYRAPADGAELASWTNVLVFGGTLQTLAQQVLDSPEYQGLHPKLAATTKTVTEHATEAPPAATLLETLTPVSLIPIDEVVL